MCTHYTFSLRYLFLLPDFHSPKFANLTGADLVIYNVQVALCCRPHLYQCPGCLLRTSVIQCFLLSHTVIDSASVSSGCPLGRGLFREVAVGTSFSAKACQDASPGWWGVQSWARLHCVSLCLPVLLQLPSCVCVEAAQRYSWFLFQVPFHTPTKINNLCANTCKRRDCLIEKWDGKADFRV